MVKLAEINEMSLDDITEQVKKSRVELVGLRMKFASRQLEDTSLIRKKRKEIARLLTIETQKSKDPEAQKKEKPVTKKTKIVKQVKEEKAKPEAAKKSLKKKGKENA